MEMEYGRPVEEIFVDITPEPLAAASLGQVPYGTQCVTCASFVHSRPPFSLDSKVEARDGGDGGGVVKRDTQSNQSREAKKRIRAKVAAHRALSACCSRLHCRDGSLSLPSLLSLLRNPLRRLF